jgi:hypothetical protein
MIKSILTAGDSFTYGEELSDLKSAWPFVLGKQLNATVTNIAEPSGSNDKILRKILDYVVNPLLTKPDLVIVGWSSPGRSEFADDMGIYDIWPGYGGKLFLKDGAIWRNDLVEYVSQYHSSGYYHKKFLQQVVLLQNFLDSQNINHLMLNTLENEYYKKHFFDEQQWYHDAINKDQFLGFNKEGMIEWAFNCKNGPNGHFLEDGHKIVANKVYEHIRNLGWLS